MEETGSQSSTRTVTQKMLKSENATSSLPRSSTVRRTDGDLDALEEIAADPEAFARRQGLGELDLSDREESESLRRLWQALQAEIISTIEAIEAIKQSPDHELAVLAEKDESFLPGVISGQEAELEREIEELSDQSRKLGEEVEELTGEPPPE